MIYLFSAYYFGLSEYKTILIHFSIEAIFLFAFPTITCWEMCRWLGSHKEFSNPVVTVWVMLILMMNKVTESRLPCGTPASWSCSSCIMLPYCTLKALWERKFLMNVAIFLLILMLYKSFNIPYLLSLFKNKKPTPCSGIG